MFSWISKDGRIVLIARGVRTFGYGFLSVILAIYLKLIGFDVFFVGLVLTVILVSGALFTVIGSSYADRIGRRKFLILFGLLMAASGFIYAVTTNAYLLIVGALIGTLSPSGGEVGPFLSIEQAVLPQTCSIEKRNSLFGLYGMLGQFSGSVGAFFSGLPILLQSSYGVGSAESYRAMFSIYSLLALATLVLYLGMSTKVELQQASTNNGSPRQRLSPKSKGIIAKLSLFFGIDAFAGGFVLQSLISYWFFTKYGVPLQYLSFIFFLAGVLSSISYIAAGRLADKIGLINTMVFTHLPSNILLIFIPLGTTFAWSIGFFLARQSISQMDVPTRQAYTVSVVAPDERTVAAGITNVSRNVSQAVSPSLAGYTMQFVSLSFPFFAAGILKIIYDITLFANFRRLKLIE